MSLLLALTDEDSLVHVTRTSPSERECLTLCGKEVTGTSGIEPVPDEKVCVDCAGELGPHDHIPLVSDRQGE